MDGFSAAPHIRPLVGQDQVLSSLYFLLTILGHGDHNGSYCPFWPIMRF